MSCNNTKAPATNETRVPAPMTTNLRNAPAEIKPRTQLTKQKTEKINININKTG